MAETHTADQSGNWNTTTTWEGDVVPLATDDVVIPEHITVTIDAAYSCKSLNLSGTLDMNGFDFSCGSLTGNGVLTNNITTPAVFTTGGGNTTVTFAGNIKGAIDLIKTGTAKFILSGVNTYSGLTIIRDGTLSLGGDESTNTIAGNIQIDGGVLDYSNAEEEQISDYSDLTINGGAFNPAARTEKIGALVINGGNLTKASNTLSITRPSAITGGTLTFSTGTASLAFSSNIVLGAATFDYTATAMGTNNIELTGTGSITYSSQNLAPAVFKNSDLGIADFQIGADKRDRVFNISKASFNEPEVQIKWNLSSGTGGASLTKIGAGTMLVTGEINYFGTTTITEGEFRLNPSINISTGTQFVLNAGQLSTTGIASGLSIISSKTLRLDASSTIDLGANQHILKFADSHGVAWNGVSLTITGWSETGGKIYFGTSASGLTTDQLAKISFTGYPGTPLLLTSGELVPSTINWIGTVNSDWANSANWSNGQVPNATTDVRIPPGLTKYPVVSEDLTADCHHLFISEGATITIESDASGSGSFILHGTFTGSGQVIYNRFMTARWHLVASPVAAGEDQPVSGFLANSVNEIYRPSTATATNNQYEMVIYREETDTWEYYEDELDAGEYFGIHPNFQNGVGYGLLRSDEGQVSFIGFPDNSDVSVPMVKSTNGWNLVGNPFTSAIKANDASGDATTNFLKVNTGNLEENYAAIYVWEEGSGYDGETNYFRVITNGTVPTTPDPVNPNTQSHIQAGQGFFVKAATNGNTVSFTRAMQSHSVATPLKSATVNNWYGLQLNVKAIDMAAHTIVSFNDDMTKGLDVTYDAGLLRSGNGLEIYSRLADDNGVDFAVQALPFSEMDKVPVPLGVDFESGGSLVFSAYVTNLPDGTQFILEDKVTGTLTNLKTDSYLVSLPANTKGTGRFYLYTGKTDFTGIDPLGNENPDIAVWVNDGLINIQGYLSGYAKAQLYDISGKLLIDLRLNDKELNHLSAHPLVKGIYILQVTDGSWKTIRKVVIN
ncbi:MAG: autotransporter-associated beta strand repeat-containing protein [Prolixibacteraceae bacterium]|jgi:autotransporter-associated beta strand protein